MNRYQNGNKASYSLPTNVSNSVIYEKMSTRRQMEHESGYYEDITEDPYSYNINANSTGSSSKRQRQASTEVVYNCGKSNKRQKANPNVGLNKKRDTSSSSTAFPDHTLIIKNRPHQQNTYGGNNIINSCTVPKNYQPQNAYSKKLNTIPGNKKETRQKNTGTNNQSSLSANNNHYSSNNNNNNYGMQNEKKHLNQHVNIPAMNFDEVVEVRDSDSETEAASSKPGQSININNGRASSQSKVMPTYVVSGSSSSNSNHSIQNYQDQQASSSKVQSSNISNSTYKDVKQKDAGASGADNNSTNNADVERLQREIEEVTQVHTKCE